MNNSEKEAIETALLWNEEGFNKRDRKISVDLMHFPHGRLWNNQFSGSIPKEIEDLQDGTYNGPPYYYDKLASSRFEFASIGRNTENYYIHK